MVLDFRLLIPIVLPFLLFFHWQLFCLIVGIDPRLSHKSISLIYFLSTFCGIFITAVMIIEGHGKNWKVKLK